jgi:hypothetical protein
MNFILSSEVTILKHQKRIKGHGISGKNTLSEQRVFPNLRNFGITYKDSNYLGCFMPCGYDDYMNNIHRSAYGTVKNSQKVKQSFWTR